MARRNDQGRRSLPCDAASTNDAAVEAQQRALPLARVVLAGMAGDTGKSLVSLGVVAGLRARGVEVAPFKKGPDFIDAAWLGEAAGRPGRNLDTFLMPNSAILESLRGAASHSGVAIIEGNRGLYDGLDARGSHSTAQLAKLTATPVVLVIDVTKVTRTVAAQVLGCRVMDPDLQLAGVILNRVGTARQERVIKEAIALETGLPVLGAIPRLTEQRLPNRYLGLVTAFEHPEKRAALEALGELAEEHVDLNGLLTLAKDTPALEPLESVTAEPAIAGVPRIGVLRDPAFSFYYPENLEALERHGAELVPVSPLDDSRLPAIDALYAGGGFPEVHAKRISDNAALRKSLAKAIDQGLPVWAECGGLMYLARSLQQSGTTFPMVGALPIEVEQQPRPQGHGYVRAQIDRANPFLREGTALRGHEFHYSRVRHGDAEVASVMAMERGTGIGAGRDGIQVAKVVASYTHLHALGTPEWAGGVVRAANGARP